MKNKFQVGDSVKYVPNHAQSQDDNICETGKVSRVDENADGTQKVWVGYGTGETGALTPTKNLVKF